MYKVVAKNEDEFLVCDDTDMSFIAVNSKIAKLILHFGVDVGGLSLNENDELSCSEQYFMHIDYEEDDDIDDGSYEDDDDLDYGDDEDDGFEEDDEDYDDYEDDDFEEDFGEDKDDYEDYAPEYDDDDEYDDGSDFEESAVSKLYKYLNEEQIKVIKRYYLWYSQRIFDENKKSSGQLNMKNSPRLRNKLEQLNIMRNSGGLWHYAGFIDMGMKGEGFCTLGHPLRYLHLAWDVSKSDIETSFFGENYNSNLDDIIESQDCIVFGIKCVTDFFEADPECIRDIQRAQREALNDMKRMYEFYESGVVDDAIKSFSFLDEVMKIIKTKDAQGLVLQKDYVPMVKKSLTSFYLQFRENNMIPPKSLVQEIRNDIVGWRQSKAVGHLQVINYTKLYETFGKIFGKKVKFIIDGINGHYSYPAENRKFTLFLHLLFAFEMCGVYKYNATKDSKDEGGTSKTVQAELEDMYEVVFNDFNASPEYLDNFISLYRNLLGYTEYKKDYYLYMLDRDGNTVLDESKWFLRNVPEEVKDAFEGLQDITYKRWSRYTIGEALAKTNQYMSTIELGREAFDKYRKDLLEKQIAEKRERERQEQERIERERLESERREQERAERERVEAERKAQIEANKPKAPSTPIELVQFLNYHRSSLNGLSSKYDFHKQIFESCAKDMTVSPSAKQLPYLVSLYKHITGDDIEISIEKKELSDYQVKALEWCKANKDKVADEKIYNIIRSVLTFNKASDRQMKYVLEGVRIYEANNT